MKKAVEFKVAGTTFENRQALLHFFRRQKDTYITFQIEKNNQFDQDAVKIIAHSVSANKHAQVGYVPKEMTKIIKTMLVNGQKVWVNSLKFTGGFKNYAVGLTVNANCFETLIER